MSVQSSEIMNTDEELKTLTLYGRENRDEGREKEKREMGKGRREKEKGKKRREKEEER